MPFGYTLNFDIVTDAVIPWPFHTRNPPVRPKVQCPWPPTAEADPLSVCDLHEEGPECNHTGHSEVDLNERKSDCSGLCMWQGIALQSRVESLERQLEWKKRRWSERMTRLQTSLERYKKSASASGKCRQMCCDSTKLQGGQKSGRPCLFSRYSYCHFIQTMYV